MTTDASTHPATKAVADLRLLIVDDQELVRTGFRLILDSEPGLNVVGEAGNGREALEWIAHNACDVVLMDVRMPELDGVAATAEIARAPDGPSVIMLTTFELDEYVFAAIQNGASGFLLKDTPADDLIDAIRIVGAGEALLAPSVTKTLIERFQTGPNNVTGAAIDPLQMLPALGDLTERETEVLVEMAKGLSNTEIGAALFVSEATVKTHVGRVLSKLGVRDRVQAVVKAYESGLVQPAPPAG